MFHLCSCLLTLSVCFVLHVQMEVQIKMDLRPLSLCRFLCVCVCHFSINGDVIWAKLRMFITQDVSEIWVSISGH